MGKYQVVSKTCATVFSEVSDRTETYYACVDPASALKIHYTTYQLPQLLKKLGIVPVPAPVDNSTVDTRASVD